MPTRAPRKNLANIRLVSFDLDDTLWDNKPVIKRAVSESIQMLDTYHSGPKTDFTILEQARTAAITAKPELSWDLTSLRHAMYEHVLCQNGLEPKLANQLAGDATQLFLRLRNRVKPFSEVPNCLAQIAKKFPIAAITNGNCDLFSVDIGQYFSFYVSPLQAQAAKPDPQIYYHAATMCGVKPDEVLHVGDCPNNDIAGAASAGMQTVWYKNGDAYFEGKQAPDYEIRSLEDLVTLLN